MPRILHLGVGNFFRAHLADYTQNCPDWRITGVSFRSPTVRDGLAAQGYGYTLLVKGAEGTERRKITCLDHILVAPEDPGAVLDAIASDAHDIISLTVTEKAYALDADGRLRPDAPEDGVVATLTRGLAQRHSPVTVLCCDNLPDNGAKVKRAVRDYAGRLGVTLPPLITFPGTMVDRITPATTDAIRVEADDPMAVPTEAFTEWVIEDNFAGPRPDWPGVQWVDDVAPHEMRKLRMLNGAHSYLAYAGTLKGHTFVHEAVADPDLRATTQALMREAAETLPQDVHSQTDAYAKALLTRFENPALEHKLRQIAMDGSQKLPIRIVATLRDRGGNEPALNAAVTAWIDFVKGEVAAGRPLDDPRAEDLKAACRTDDPDAALRALIGA